MPIRTRISRLGMLAAGLALLAPSIADAQIKDVEPYHVVITGDNVNLRCGDGTVWYSVDKLSEGQVLRVDGEGFGWLRVAYPEGTSALVSVDQADLRAGRGVVVITRPSQLKANNARASRVADSWKNLLAEPLEPGAELRHVETIRDESGEPQAYLVEAPDGARGFVSEQFTREATAEEVREAQARAERRERAQRERTEEETPSDDSDADESTPTGDQADADGEDVNTAQPAEDDAETEQRDAADADHDPSSQPAEAPSSDPTETSKPERRGADQQQPNEPPRGQPSEQSERTQTDESEAPSSSPAVSPGSGDEDSARRDPSAADQPETQRSQGDQTDQPDASGQSEQPQERPTPDQREQRTEDQPEEQTGVDRPLPTMEELDSAFRAVMDSPVESAEVKPLIAEHRRLLDSLGEDEEAEGPRRRLESRISLLNIRLDLQRSMRRIERVQQRAERGAETIERTAADLDRRRPYELVGRLTTSAVYNGDRLPLMYRLQSAEGDSQRTLAYIVPSDQFDLRAKLGSIVGVEGRSRVDEALGVKIVRPSRVDALEPVASASDR